MFLLSFVVVLYLTVSGVRRLADVDFLARCLVAGGAIVSVFAIVEARLGFNAFNHLATVMPFLRDLGDVGGFQRVGTAQLRVFASAQHPIALSAALVMLAPLAIYLARRHGQRRWLVCALVLGVACASTVSRTGVVMFLVVALVFLWLRPRETLRLWPALLAAVDPHARRAARHARSDQELVLPSRRPHRRAARKRRFQRKRPARRSRPRPRALDATANPRAGVRDERGQSRRGRDRGEHLRRPVARNAARDGDRRLRGLGAGSSCAPSVASVGRRCEDTSERGWLLTAITAGIAAYGVGMLTYDAFAFIQVTFLLFILVGLGSVVIQAESDRRPRPWRSRSAFRRRPVTNPA